MASRHETISAVGPAPRTDENLSQAPTPFQEAQCLLGDCRAGMFHQEYLRYPNLHLGPAVNLPHLSSSHPFHYLTIAPGETLGIVGESGCGKTTTAKLILAQEAVTGGSIEFRGRDVASLRKGDLMDYRKSVQIVFQDPAGALNPRMRIGDFVAEPMVVHGIGDSKKDRRQRAAALLERCGVSSDAMRRRPHEFSGGQRQRIVIARALTLSPTLLVCDEPTSALDVSVQSQILNLLKDLQRDLGLSMLFISHDMAVIRHMCDRIAVMQDGSIVEIGDRDEVIDSPKAEYTRQLLEAVPQVA